MLEVKFDKKLERYIVTPLIKNPTQDFIIICKNEFEAKSLCTQVAMGMIQSPLDCPENYIEESISTDESLKIFKLK